MSNTKELAELKDETAKAKFKKAYKFLNKEQKKSVDILIGAAKVPTAPETTPPHAHLPPTASPAAQNVTVPPQDPSAVSDSVIPTVKPPTLPPLSKAAKSIVREDKLPEGAIVALFVCAKGEKTKGTVMDKDVKCRICGGDTKMKCYYDLNGRTVMAPGWVTK